MFSKVLLSKILHNFKMGKNMKQKVVIFFLLAFALIPKNGYGQNTPPYIITFFFKPDLYNYETMNHKDIQEHLETPGKFAYKLHKKDLINKFKVDGIFVAYAGYFMASDSVGQITFPRKNQKNQVKILVTQSIKPIFVPTIEIPTKTILSWQIAAPAKVAYYIAELKKSDEGNTYYWYITEGKFPKNNKIPTDAVIVFADPKYIKVPLGAVEIAANSPHFILPDLYVSPKLNTALSALRFLKIKKYFSPVHFEYKMENQGFIRQIS